MAAKGGQGFWGGQGVELTDENLEKGFADIMLTVSAYLGYSIQSGKTEIAKHFLAHIKTIETIAYEGLASKSQDVEEIRQQVETLTTEMLAK